MGDKGVGMKNSKWTLQMAQAFGIGLIFPLWVLAESCSTAESRLIGALRPLLFTNLVAVQSQQLPPFSESGCYKVSILI